MIVHRFGSLDAKQISGITPASARASFSSNGRT
jgi:hypothetical protein